MERKTRSSYIDFALLISVVAHAGMIVGFSRATPASGPCYDLQEVTFMDVTYRPEVAQVLSKIAPGGGGDASDAAAYGPGSTYTDEDVPALDLNSTLDRDNSQAKIDLDRYELDRGDGLGTIRLGGEGSGKSNDEILAQPRVALNRGPGRGPGTPGLRGFPGVPQPEAQLTIEHRPLAKAPTTQLPQMNTQDLPKVTGPVSKGTNFMVAGPISQRKIVSKVVPRYPQWALQQRISGTVVIRIWVQPGGKVKGTPTVESSSGYPDLDQVVVNALKAWEFAPLEAGAKSEDQWGVITFRFTLS